MNRSNKFATSEILKIEPLENGKYEVFFTFSDVPVVMNKSYLETVLPAKEAYQML